jgi:hypothetical protein
MAGRIRFTIKTPRLTIRPMEVGDAEALLSVYGDMETMHHLSSVYLITREDWLTRS